MTKRVTAAPPPADVQQGLLFDLTAAPAVAVMRPESTDETIATAPVPETPLTPASVAPTAMPQSTPTRPPRPVAAALAESTATRAKPQRHRPTPVRPVSSSSRLPPRLEIPSTLQPPGSPHAPYIQAAVGAALLSTLWQRASRDTARLRAECEHLTLHVDTSYVEAAAQVLSESPVLKATIELLALSVQVEEHPAGNTTAQSEPEHHTLHETNSADALSELQDNQDSDPLLDIPESLLSVSSDDDVPHPAECEALLLRIEQRFDEHFLHSSGD